MKKLIVSFKCKEPVRKKEVSQTYENSYNYGKISIEGGSIIAKDVNKPNK